MTDVKALATACLQNAKTYLLLVMDEEKEFEIHAEGSRKKLAEMIGHLIHERMLMVTRQDLAFGEVELKKEDLK